jgi:co-chaperonin GroES (HSP10)
MRYDNGRYKTIKDPKSENHYIVMDEKTKTAERFLQRGHWLYVRRNERAESINGIYLPERSRDDTLCCEVIAIGAKVSQFRKYEKKMKDVVDFCANSDIDVSVGDTVVVPETAVEYITRSPWNEDEWMIDKGLIKCVLE